MTTEDAVLVEQRIVEAHLGPYQAMVIRAIARDENVTTALDFVAKLRKVNGDAERK